MYMYIVDICPLLHSCFTLYHNNFISFHFILFRKLLLVIVFFDYSFSLDPTLRYTMWNVMIGNTAKLFYFPLSQSSVQRIGCMPTIKDAYK